MKKFQFLLSLGLAVMLFSSCAHWKDIAYFQNSEYVDLSQSTGLYDARIMPKDQISVSINTINPEVSSSFNLLLRPSSVGGSTIGSSTQMPYLVDNDGYINFPILGKIKVVGLTIRECEALILKRIQPYMAENEKPHVTVRFSDFSVTVLGEVGHPGIVQSRREKLSVLEALALAGDATIYGIRNPVKLIREDTEGRRTFHDLNLNDAEILNSPYYYLQQNDILYVEPRKEKITFLNMDRTRNFIGFGTLLVSVATLAYTISKK